MHNRISFFLLFIAVTSLLVVAHSQEQPKEKDLLRLVQTIPLPDVKGRLDHMDVDVKGSRLFVAGLENGSLEVVDLQTAKRTLTDDVLTQMES